MDNFNTGPMIPYIKTIWEESMEITTSKLTKIENLLELVTNYLSSIAPLYEIGQAYEIGDYCIYDALLWKCNTAITAAQNTNWDLNKWTSQTIASIISEADSIIPLNKGGTGLAANSLAALQTYLEIPTDYIRKEAEDTKNSALKLSHLQILKQSANNSNALIYFYAGNESTFGGYISYDPTNKNFYFGQYVIPGDINKHRELYFLPAPPNNDWSNTESDTKSYAILTAKNTITIALGGTGATDAAVALSNLGAAADSDVVHRETTVPEYMAGIKVFTDKIIIAKNNKAVSSIYFKNNLDNTLPDNPIYYNGYIQMNGGAASNLTVNLFNFYEYSPKSISAATNNTYCECYLLPAPTKGLNQDTTYTIHTDKLFSGSYLLIYSDSNNKAVTLSANTSGLKFLSMNGAAAPTWHSLPFTINSGTTNRLAYYSQDTGLSANTFSFSTGPVTTGTGTTVTENTLSNVNGNRTMISSSSTFTLQTRNDASIIFSTHDISRWSINGSGHLLPSEAGKDIGANTASQRVSNIYATTIDATTLKGNLVGSIDNKTYLLSTVIAKDTNWNNLIDTGLYISSAEADYTGTGNPNTNASTFNNGILLTLRAYTTTNSASEITQIFYPRYNSDATAIQCSIRYRTGQLASTNTWSNWVVLLDSRNYDKYALNIGSGASITSGDLNNYKLGSYNITSSNINNVEHRPNVSYGITLKSLYHLGSANTIQFAWGNVNGPDIYTRILGNPDWSDWRRFINTEDWGYKYHTGWVGGSSFTNVASQIWNTYEPGYILDYCYGNLSDITTTNMFASNLNTIQLYVVNRRTVDSNLTTWYYSFIVLYTNYTGSTKHECVGICLTPTPTYLPFLFMYTTNQTYITQYNGNYFMKLL